MAESKSNAPTPSPDTAVASRERGEGFVLVPKQATKAMLDAAYAAHDAYLEADGDAGWGGLGSVYAAMIAAAPALAAPVQEGSSGEPFGTDHSSETKPAGSLGASRECSSRDPANDTARLRYWVSSFYEMLRECQAEFKALGAKGIAETIEAKCERYRTEAPGLAAASPSGKVDGNVWMVAKHLGDTQRSQPEWLWFVEDRTDGIPVVRYSFGRWAKLPEQAPYVRADIALGIGEGRSVVMSDEFERLRIARDSFKDLARENAIAAERLAAENAQLRSDLTAAREERDEAHRLRGVEKQLRSDADTYGY